METPSTATKTPERINIKQFDLENERVTEPISLYIELGENYLMYVAEFYSEVPKAENQDDHTLGWEDSYSNFKIKVKRECIVSIDINYKRKGELWIIELDVNGYPHTIKFYFKKEKDAAAVHKKLDEYIFGTTTV